MPKPSAHFFHHPRLPLHLFFAFLTICALGGGASRADVQSLMFVRTAAVLFIAACLLLPGSGQWQRMRAPFIFIILCAILLLLQMIPLPPEVWLQLPGRAFYAEAAAAVGIEQPWRPISLTPDLTLNSLLSLLPPAAALVALVYVKSEDRHLLLTALVAVALLSAIFGILQSSGAKSLVLYRIWSIGSPVGLFANRNHQAALLAAAVPLLIAWGRRPELKGSRKMTSYQWSSLAACLLLVPLILVTGSRSGLVLMGIGVLLAFLFIFVDPHQERLIHRKSRLAKLVPALVVSTVLGLLAATVLLARAESLKRLLNLDTGEDTRLAMLDPMIEMLSSFFPFGSGFGSFEPVFRRFEPEAALDTSYFNHAHNDFLELLIEGGIFGATLFFIFLTWWVMQGWRVWKKERDARSSFYGRAGFIVSFILLLASIFDYPLRTPLLATIFAICCGWIHLRPRSVSPGRVR